MKRRRVLVVSPIFTGALGFFCQRAFEKMGHEVRAFDYRKVALGDDYLQFKEAGRLRILRNIIGIRQMNRQLPQVVSSFRPDLVLAVKGELIEAATVAAIREKSAVALWYPDASSFLTKRNFRRIAQGMAHYSATFLCDPDHIPESVRPTIHRLVFMAFACDPDFHRPVSLTAEEQAHYGSVICFVGNKQSTTSLRDVALPALAKDMPLSIWGYGWEESEVAQTKPAALRGPAYGEALRKVYSSCQMALNFSYAHYLNFRNFEVPACGPLLVTEHVPHLEQFFAAGREVVAFHDLDELRELLRYYLAHPEGAEKIARQGQQRALAEHTFVNRMQRIMDEVLAA